MHLQRQPPPPQSEINQPLDHALSNPAPSPQRRVLLILGVFCAIVFLLVGLQLFQPADPYVKAVLSLSGDPAQGHAIFQINCAGCHGIQADGRVGPSLANISKRKSRTGLIHQVVSGATPPMPQFQPSPQEMADLLKYLEQL